MTPEIEEAFRASKELRERLRKEDGLQFDGDPHWERAMELLAQEAVKRGLAMRAAQQAND